VDGGNSSWSNRTTDILKGFPQGLISASGKFAPELSVEIETAPEPPRNREIRMAVGQILEDLLGNELRKSNSLFSEHEGQKRLPPSFAGKCQEATAAALSTEETTEAPVQDAALQVFFYNADPVGT
jgi:hypothetical protein